jgi:hypothetical protein
MRPLWPPCAADGRLLRAGRAPHRASARPPDVPSRPAPRTVAGELTGARTAALTAKVNVPRRAG